MSVCAGLIHKLEFALDALVGDQKRQRERIGIEVAIPRDTADSAGGTDLPIGPTILGAGIHIVTATAATIPWIASVQVFTVVVGYPRRENARRRQVAHSGTGAGIDHRAQEVPGLRFHPGRPLIEPRGITAIADVAIEHFEVHHRIERLAIRGDLGAGESPEVVGFGICADLVRTREIVCAHLHSGGLAVVHVGDEPVIVVVIAFSGFGEGVLRTAAVYAGPIDRTLPVRYVNPQQIVRLRRRGQEGHCRHREQPQG